MENDWHVVEISMISEGKYEWKNKAGVKWSLTTKGIDSCDIEIGEDCPYYDDDYTSASFNSSGIFGPHNEFYVYQG